MKKEDAKQLLASTHDEILKQIERHEGEDVNTSVLIDFLHDIANQIIKNPKHLAASGQLAFEHEYRALAQESLDSYIYTNKSFTAITEDNAIDLGEVDTVEDLSNRFNNVQEQLRCEIDRTNDTIGKLLVKIRELENKSSIDPLTKVYNRRALDQHLSDIFDKVKGAKGLYHLLMIDVDDFKHINDRFGHTTGDKVLIYLANMLKHTLREGDKVFRYGGEEFIVILNRATHESCEAVCHRLLELPRTNKLIFKDQQISVTISIGATYVRDADTVESLIERADKALYRAKNNGKNQIVLEW